MGFLIWDIRTRTSSSKSFTFHSGQLVGTTESHALDSSQVLGNVTFTNGSFINATVTIVRPINLNGSMIDCNRDILTLNIPTRSSKFFCHSTNTGKGEVYSASLKVDVNIVNKIIILFFTKFSMPPEHC